MNDCHRLSLIIVLGGARVFSEREKHPGGDTNSIAMQELRPLTYLWTMKHCRQHFVISCGQASRLSRPIDASQGQNFICTLFN
mmetsp:Transcript_53199/g.104147  ORF Transcript_53199/g.104147 Transcript_53199/m.104147 type:complete len:83 (-) Transcript_53199:46-294(-)